MVNILRHCEDSLIAEQRGLLLFDVLLASHVCAIGPISTRQLNLIPLCAGWCAVINSTVQGKKCRQLLGPFPTEEDAARKYDEASAALGRPVNFPAFGAGGIELKRVKKDAASSFLGGS